MSSYNTRRWKASVYISLALPTSSDRQHGSERRSRISARHSVLGTAIFLRSLLSCPSLRTIQIDLGVDLNHYYGPMDDSHLHKIAKTFIKMAKAYTELQIKFGHNLKLGTVGQAVRGGVIVPRMDLCWLFPPVDGATNLHEPPISTFKKSMASKLAPCLYSMGSTRAGTEMRTIMSAWF